MKKFRLEEYRQRLAEQAQALQGEFIQQYLKDNGLEKGVVILYDGEQIRVAGAIFNDSHFPIVQGRSAELKDGRWVNKEGFSLVQVKLENEFEILHPKSKRGEGTNVAPLRRNWSRSKGIKGGGRNPIRH